MNCRFCAESNLELVVDLGMSPLSNAYLGSHQLDAAEVFYPLAPYVCPRCFLVQVGEFEKPENIFSDYAYFSSYSDSWLEHCRAYARQIRSELALGSGNLVVEIASNDGYLLQFFREEQIPVLGIEPAANVARVAEQRGIPTITRFFGTELAEELRTQQQHADLLIGNNVLAHVPRINDFVSGLKLLLAESGTITMEFPHLLRLLEHTQFDTIYHEHFSYLSLHTVRAIFAAHGLHVYDVQELPTHGGSLRIFARHAEANAAETDRLHKVLADEQAGGITSMETYRRFADRVARVKRQLLSFLIAAKEQGRRVVGYGAAAKGNTLLNYCGIRTDLIDYVVDRSPHKQGLFLPGTHIPILAPEQIFADKPDYVLILPWNLESEIVSSMGGISEWGGQFVVPIPELRIAQCALPS